MGIKNFKINMPIHFSNFLDDFFNDEQLLPSFMKENSNQCNSCGEFYNDFIKTGLLGCAECYDMFEDRLDPVLKNIQGHVKHVGRKPLNISEKMQNTGENSTKKSSKSNNKTENNELEQLKKDLNKAIEEERSEDAATIRDKIKQINDNK